MTMYTQEKNKTSQKTIMSILVLVLILIVLYFIFRSKKIEHKPASVLSVTEERDQKQRFVHKKDILKNMKYISFGTQNIKSYFAETTDERARGLSVFDTFGDNESMLFIFEKEGFHSFWMKGMKFAIDIIWLNKDREIVFIKENAHPNDYPEPYLPDRKSLYVIEFVSGFVEKNSIKIGDSFEWTE